MMLQISQRIIRLLDILMSLNIYLMKSMTKMLREIKRWRVKDEHGYMVRKI